MVINLRRGICNLLDFLKLYFEFSLEWYWPIWVSPLSQRVWFKWLKVLKSLRNVKMCPKLQNIPHDPLVLTGTKIEEKIGVFSYIFVICENDKNDPVREAECFYLKPIFDWEGGRGRGCFYGLHCLKRKMSFPWDWFISFCWRLAPF